jgi:hypothetical protein
VGGIERDRNGKTVNNGHGRRAEQLEGQSIYSSVSEEVDSVMD